MAKVVYNSCYGGFCFSLRACERLVDLGVPNADLEGSYEVCRHDPRVVAVVEDMGSSASGPCAALAVEEIAGERYRIDEYDGRETVEVPEDGDWIYVEESR